MVIRLLAFLEKILKKKTHYSTLTKTMTLIIRSFSVRLTIILILFISTSENSFAQNQNVIISEFMAINNSTLADEDGDFSDWIEIHNSGTLAIQLNNWFLTDNPLNLTKWSFPNINLEAGSYLIVFASEKNRKAINGNLHTNFKLSGSGEYLALIEPDGSTFRSDFGDGYPAQQQDVSYGLIGDHFIYISEPTPGEENTSGGLPSAPIFSHSRGFYEASFNLSLDKVNLNHDLFYTVDGSVPTTGSTKYITPISIDKTTVLSAIAIDPSNQSLSNVVTQTFLFDDVLTQSNKPAGYPSVWGQGFPGDYEMDPEICTPENKTELIASLKSIPTVSLVLDVDHLFLDSEDINEAGIYLNSTQAADEWERPVSMEYFDPEQNLGFQVNCGLRVHGGNGRKPGNSPKHSFRVSFRSEYGPSKLNFNMFDKSATNEFNALVLRAGYNYSWLKNSPAQCEGTDYIRDPFTKTTQLAMDRVAAHRKYVHLYLNGMYWGLYDISEKITNDFIEAYLGGKEEDYDVVKDHNGVTDGDRLAWLELLSAVSAGLETNVKYQKIQGKNEDGSENAAYSNLLDVRNLTDYMIINFYIGNGDWDRNNWLAARNRVTNKEGFKFFCWDAETSMNDVNENIVDINNPENPSAIFNALIKNEEYKLFFADRVQKHFFNGGALTKEETAARFMEIADEIYGALPAESARWGDYRRDVDGGSTYSVYTRENQWQTRVDFMENNYLPQRTDIVFNQLKSKGLFPSIDAPTFNSMGGDFEEAVSLSISANSGDIYYTVDDSDPREIGGAVSTSRAFSYTEPIDINENTIIKARAKNGNTWSAMTRARFNVKTAILTIVEPEICQGENFLSFIESGTYNIVEKSKSGADSLVEIHLTVNPLPEINLGNDTTIFINTTLIIEANETFESYKWSTSETTKSIEITGNEIGEFEYWLDVTNSFGCVNTDHIVVKVIEESEILKLDEEQLSATLKVYPNPTSDVINVEFGRKNNPEAFVEILSLSGKSMYKSYLNLDNSINQINLHFLAKGIYILDIMTPEFEKSMEIIKLE